MVLSLIEQLFPTRKDYRIVRDKKIDELLRLLTPTVGGEITYLLSFHEPLVRAAIHEAKFHQNEKASVMLSLVLVSYLKHHDDDVIILPIPLSFKRQKKRKYNQIEEVLKKARKLRKEINFRNDILFRIRDTTPQTSLSKKERLANMVDAFGAHHVGYVEGKNIIIIDDVTTTGATLKQAKAALAPLKPSSITLLALAH